VGVDARYYNNTLISLVLTFSDISDFHLVVIKCNHRLLMLQVQLPQVCAPEMPSTVASEPVIPTTSSTQSSPRACVPSTLSTYDMERLKSPQKCQQATGSGPVDCVTIIIFFVFILEYVLLPKCSIKPHKTVHSVQCPHTDKGKNDGNCWSFKDMVHHLHHSTVGPDIWIPF